MNTLSELIAVLREKRVQLWEDNGDLRLSAPRDALTPELTGALRARKAELIEFLRNAREGSAPARVVAPDTTSAPRLLSYAQERLWFLEKLGGAGAAYNVAAAVRIVGALDVDALSRAFEEVQRRHEVLRARFVEVDGEPRQIVRAGAAALDLVDSTVLDAGAAIAAAEDAARMPFDIAADRLLRAQLYRIGPQQHLLAVTMHHLVSDGLSLDILVRELVTLYHAFKSAQPSALSPLPFQYADFASSQRQWLSSDQVDTEVQYWRDLLADAPDAIELPTDRPRASRPSFGGANIPVSLTAASADAVHRYARDTGATPFMIMLAAYAILLGRSSSQDDVVVGIPVANRSAEGADRVMGLFVNALPIRVRCGDATSFAGLVAQVKESVLGALAHADVPWEFLLDALEPRRDLSRPPVFQVTFTLQDDPASALKIAGLTFEPVALSTASAKFDMSLELQRTEGGTDTRISGVLEYNTELFDAATASSFVTRYLRLVDHLVAAPDAPLSSLDLVSPDERAALVQAWSGPAVDFALDRNIAQAFAARVQRHPDRPAVVLRDRVLTFAELDRQARRVARSLVAAGVRPTQTVGVLVSRTTETIAALLGVILAGAAYVPLDPTWPEQRRRQVVDLAGCAAVVAPDAVADAPAVGLPESGAHDPAYVLFTSGSTGAPKGVVVEHASVLHLVAALEHSVYAPLGVDDSVRVSVNGALTFDTSVKQVFQLLQGRTLVLIPEDVRLDGRALLSYVAETNVGVLDCTPSQLSLLADAGLGDARTPVRVLLSGGEALTPALWQRLRGPRAPAVVNLYGPTECTVDATVHLLDRSDAVPLLGRPLPNMQVLVLDEALKPAPAGMPGELFIGGPGVARGYLGDPSLTRDRFIANPFPEIRSARLYRTGDRGRLRADGRLEYLGRLDHQIKLRGHRVELAEIERVLEQHDGVRAACALVAGESGAERLVAVAAVDPLRCATAGARKRYSLPNGLAIAQLNPNETDFLYKEMFERNAYLRHGVDVRDNDVVLDVGSNIGMFAVSMQVRRAGLRFVFVEPNPHVREILMENARIFGMDASVHDCGVSSAEGQADFTFYPGFSILSGLHADTAADKAVVRSYIKRQTEDSDGEIEGVEEILEVKFQSITLPVRLRPLGDLIDASGLTRIDLLKINIERAELDALAGIRDDQWPMIRQIAVEVHDVEGRLQTVLALLRSKGFDIGVDEDWSLEHAVGTNYYLYAVRPGLAATPHPDATGAERLRLFTQPFLTPADLRAHLEARLPDYMTPSAITIVDRLPMTAHGKVDRRLLAQQSWQPDGETSDEVMTEAERVVAGHWQTVLKLTAVGPRDNFFRVGGHSLSAVRLAAQLSDVFAVQFSVAAIFEHPVLRDMAIALQDSVAAEPLPPIEPQPAPADGALPVSYAQERLLFLEHFEGGGRAYVIAGAAELHGALNTTALQSALRSIATRHNVLRSTFSLATGTAAARIIETLPELEYVDVSNASDARADAHAWMRARAAEPFDIERGLPLRTALLRVGPAQHILFIAFHHLVADGWSVALFVQELSQWYRHHAAAGDAPQPLRIGYYDYASWQRTWLSGPRLERGLEYWTKRLAGASPFIALPTDRPRPDVNAYRGETIAFELPADTRARIEECARALEATPFMLLLGVFTALLHRWTGQADIVVGSPSAGRGHAGTEDLIGLFVNMLVLRLDAGGATTFRALMADVRRTTLEALAHEDVPFERIVEALRPPRLLNRHPVFQVLFALQNLPADPIDLPSVTWTPAPFDAPTGRFDLELVFDEQPAGYRATLEYSTDLFDEQTMARVVEQYGTLLAKVLADPDEALATIDLTDERALAEINALGRVEPETAFISAPQMVADQARLHPSAPALAYRGATLSYADMMRRVRAQALAMRGRGVGTGDIVAICTDRSPVWVISALATLELGAVFLPIDPDYPSDRIKWMLDDSRAKLVITEELANEKSDVGDVARPFQGRDNAVLGPATPAYLIYTSGSTGQPKGALNTHGGLANLTRNFIEIFEAGPESRVLHFASIGFDASVVDVFMTLASGGCFHLADREQLLPGQPLADTLLRERITHVTLPPSVLGGMTDAPFADLRVLIAAGEACSRDLVERWIAGRRFFNNYGPTEAAVCATIAECHPGDSRITIGRPIRHVQVFVVDPAMRAVPVGCVGEICVGGAGVAIGYWQRPALTAEKFVVADPNRSGTPQRIYRTGDQGRLLADGSIEFLGRRDQQIKLNGFRIELGEIETALRLHPSVRDCAVVVQEPAGEHRRLVAFVIGVRARPEDGGARTLKEFLRSRLPDYMVPPMFVDIDRLPLTPNGKLDRRGLEQWTVASPRPGAPSTSPASDTAHVVAAIFAEVLKRPSFGTRDDFFEHGGHSLLAAQVMARVRERLRTDLTLRTLFEAPTPRALAARVDAAVASGLPPLVATARFDERAVLSSAQRRLWFLDQLDSSHAAYNIVAAARLRGALDIDALRAAVRSLSDRHEILRTHYPAVNGEPTVALGVAAAELNIVDVSDWEEALRFADDEGRRPFDLGSGPLFRPTLYRTGNEWLFVATMHHIVSDGWSIGVLVQELGALYQSAREHTTPPPGPTVQYGDYARWLDRAIDGPLLARQLDFWKQRLAGAPAALELPTDHPRPPMQTFRGGAVRFSISAAVALALRTVARDHDATLFMTLAAAFTAWLHRYSGQSDIVIGTPVANRRVREVEALVGLFANTLPLRTRVSGDEPFGAMLRRVRGETLDAFSHPDAPFDAIVEAVQPERHLSHSPLFQVMFAQTSGLVGALQLSDLVIEPLSLESGAAKFDLTLFVDEGGADEALTATLEYNADLFHADTAQRMAANFTALVDGIAAAPATAIDDLPALGPSDRALLASWNDTAVANRARTFFDLFDEQVRLKPDTTAVSQVRLKPDTTYNPDVVSGFSRTRYNPDVVSGFSRTRYNPDVVSGFSRARYNPDVVSGFSRTSEITYRSLDQRANQLARHLRSLGVGRETLVAIFLERSPDLIVALLGVLRAGGAYVPMDVQYPPARLSFMLEDSGAPVVITTSTLAAHLPSTSARLVQMDREQTQIGSLSDARPEHDLQLGDLAYMIYTSGSTGAPKGVLIEHRGLANYLEWAAREYRMAEGSGAPVVGSISFDATITSLFGPLAAGQQLVLLPEGRELETLSSASLAGADHTFYKITPSHLDGLNALTDPATLAGRVRELVIGGEALASASLEPWKTFAPDVVVTNEYGPTETVVGCAIYRVAARDLPNGVIPIGRPIANTVMHLLDERRRPVPVGAVGEIYIGGHGVARGYHKRPELTAERFVELQVGDAPAARFYRTGDLARWTHDGQLLFLGRMDGQIKLRGHRIELGEIESAARQQDDVANAAAVLQHPSNRDAHLALYLVAQPGVVLDIDAVHDLLQTKLPDIMVPARIRQLDALPLTPNGKIDRDALARLDEPEIATKAPSARDHVRDLVAGLWTSLLGAPPASPDSDFFASGGHSLLAARLTSKIRETFGVDLQLRTVLEHPTWEGLSQAVVRGRRTAGALPAISRSMDAPVLSFGQQRLWALEQLEHPGAAYHIPAAFRLRGPVDADALERALNTVASRHEVLRTHFPVRDGRADVRVLPHLGRMLRESASEDALEPRLRDFVLAPFDLAQGPLVRAALFQLGADDHVFVVVMHHLVSDGWSSAILASELRESYTGEHDLPALPFQYSDYAAWQRHALSGDALERLKAYWTEVLRDAPPALELPIFAARPATQSYRGAVLEFQLDAAHRDRLTALARREGVTLYMLLLAAYATVLSRWSGQDDLVIGTPMANRSAGTDALVGFFVNTLPLRFRLPGGMTFHDLLAHVRDTALGAFDHQELPFERLVDIVNPPRNPSVSPIFQVLFTYQAEAAGLTLPGVTVEPIHAPHESAKFDVTMAIDEGAAGLDGYIEYGADLFDEDAIAGVRDRFIAVLDAMTADVTTAVHDAPMLTARDRQQVALWNDTAHDYLETRLIHQMIADQARQTPDAVALVFEGETLSYAELDARAETLAQALRRAGVGPDVAVGISIERSFELLIAVLGILKAGGAYVPLDPEYPAERLAGMREDAALKIVITRESEIWDSSRGPERPALHTTEEPALHTTEGPALHTERPALHTRDAASDLAYIIFTSGSTGRPKGAMIEHAAIRNRLLWMQDAYKLTPSDVVLQKTPVSFDVSVWELFWPLMYGARLVIARPGGHRDGAYLANLIAEQRVSTLHFVPSMLQAFLEEPAIETLGSLRRVFCSGEALPWEVVRRFEQRIGCPLHNLYGPTEAAVDVTYWPCRTDTPGRVVPIGKPIANTQIHILDDRMRQTPVGVAGELYIGGVNLARGYVNRPDLTAERFVTHDGQRLYRTGDLARWRPDGQIEYLGRLDAQVKLRGFRIELGEIETALMQHPGVGEAAAALVNEGHPRIVGYVVPRGAMPGADALRRHLAERLPEYMVPSAFVELQHLPLGATGKLDRKALPKPQIETSTTFEAPRTAAERVLAPIWEDVLGVVGVGRDQNFFELGGDSILAIQMAARARRAGLEVSPRLLLEHQTLASLCEAAAAARPISAEQGLLDGDVPAPPIVRWFNALGLANPKHFNQSVVLSVQPGLDARVIERAVRMLVEHHDALRLRWDGTLGLRYGSIEGAYVFEVIEGASVEEAAARMQASLDPIDGPLSRIAYFPDRHRFVWVAHHLAVDAVSWGILLDDLDRICRLLVSGREPALPAKTTSLREWARALPQSGQQVEHQGAALEQQLLAALRTSWSRVIGAAAVRIDVEGHGRASASADVDLSRTVGWFTSIERDGASSGQAEILFNYLGRTVDHGDANALFGPADDDLGPSSDPRNTMPYAVELVIAAGLNGVEMRWSSPDRSLGRDVLDRLDEEMRAALPARHDEVPSHSPVAVLPREGYSPLVRIRDVADGSAPLFLVHPGGGTVLCYRDLAQRLRVPVYGLQAPGLADGESAIESVETLASIYLDAIVRKQPSGAYRLGGWSFGGVVAFEIARQLRQQNRDVELLAVLDVHAPGAIAPEAWNRDNAHLLVDIFAEDIGVRHDDLRGRSIDEQLDIITRRAISAGLFPAGFTSAMARRAWDVFQTHRRAERRYEGGPLAGELLLVTSDSRVNETDPTLGWTRFANHVVRRAVPGNHQQILRVPAVDALAEALTEKLVATDELPRST